MTFSPWGNEKMKVLAKCFEIFRYKNGERSVVMAPLLPGCFIKRKCGLGGEGRLEDEDHCKDHCRDPCLSGCKARGVWGLAQVGRGFGGAPAHLPGTLQGQAPMAEVIWVTQVKPPAWVWIL